MMTVNILAAETEHNMLLPAPADLIWGSLAFAIIAVAIYFLAWPTFVRILDERRTQIEDGLAAAARAREEMALERANLADEVDEAHREAAHIRNQAKVNAADIVEKAKKDAVVGAQRIADTAHRQLEADTEAAKRVLRAEVGSLAIELAEKIVGAQALDPKVSEDIVDRFLDELEQQNTAPVAAKSREG